MKIVVTLAAMAAAAALQPYAALAKPGDGACRASNGVTYNPQTIFDPLYICYPASPTTCPEPDSVCANHALVKLGNYAGEGKGLNDYQDLIYSPHRGLWGQTYGSTDPAFTTPPGQNTNQAFALVSSFTANPKYRVNALGVDYGAFLRGRLLELDVTTNGNDVQQTPTAVVDHYVTTDNTVQGTLNTYLSSISDAALSKATGNLEKRDFSASPMTLSQTPVAAVTKAVIVNAQDPRFGLTAYLDTKARRGDLQCQVFAIPESSPDFAKYHCAFNDPATSDHQQILAQIISAQAMFDAGGTRNIVIKTTATYWEMLAAIGGHYNLTPAQSDKLMRRYIWLPHPKGKGGVQAWVNYVHGWLTHVPRSVEAWETNIYFQDDETNKPFCVTKYTPPVGPNTDGVIETKYVTSVKDKDGCAYGPYWNLLDYFRQNTGNPDYFGFTPQQKAERLISGNRANLWLLDTSAASGTSDREYRWQMLGSDPTYNMSDPVRELNYPYAAYQMINGDRLDAVQQVVAGGVFPRWGPAGPVGLAAKSERSQAEVLPDHHPRTTTRGREDDDSQ